MFWGLILEPYKRYSQTVSKAFHISNAALDSSTGDNEMCQVMVGAQGKEFLICSLQKGKNLQTPLDLYFKEGSEISFSSSGKGVIHLTGYLDPELYEDGEETESDMEDEDEIPELTPIDKKKRKAESSPSGALSKKMKKEMEKLMKNSKKSNDSTLDDEDDDESDDDEEEGKDLLAKLLQDDESDANDESYVPNETSEVSVADSDDDDEDEDEDDEDDDDDEDSDDSDEKSSPQVSPPKGQKQKKDKKADKPQQNGFAEKNKANKENEQKQSQEEKIKKVLPGNVAIEDLKVGQGAPAKPGKMVQVYYEGRLKSNNKMFDSCLKGPGFKFKLGKKEVISGWDVGVAGMKVGGKRRIVCPPGMAYGKKGSPPVIPPNSTLVFDVELKGVN